MTIQNLNNYKYCLAFVVFMSISCVFKEDTNKMTDSDSGGIWVLTNYFDSMIRNKSVAKTALNKMSFHNIVIKLDGNKVQVGGVVNWLITFQRNLDDDTFYFNSNFGKFKYFFNNGGLSCIMNNDNNIVYQYRRTNNTQLNEIFEVYDRAKFIDYMQRMIITDIFNGKFKIQTNSGDSNFITFNPNNSISGLYDFKSFRIHDYIGTFNPFKGLDAITFSNIGNKKLYFNWSFSADTLILKKFETNDDEHYKLSGNVLKLLRVN